MDTKVLLPYQNLIIKWMTNYIQNSLFIKQNHVYQHFENNFDSEEDYIALQKYIENNGSHTCKSGILALDMGLGKTFIAIKYIKIMQFKYNIIVLPPNVLQQWIKEIKENNIIFTIYNNKDFNMQCLNFNKYGHNIVIVSYYKLNNFIKGIQNNINNQEININFDAIIADEIHICANKKTSFNKNMNIIKNYAKVVWGLTGTPIINSINDIINIKNIVKNSNTNIDMFKAYNFIHINKDDSFIQDQIKLPNKIISNLFIQMDPWQTKQYIKLLFGVKSAFCSNNNINTITLLNKLRQCAVHPAIMNNNNDDDTVQIEPVVVNDELDLLDNNNIINNMGNKYKQMINIIQNTPEEDKIIIFTNWNKENIQIKNILNHFNINNIVYSKFNDIENIINNNIKVILCNIKKCSTGLNLQFANHIIFMEPPWNSATIKQAIDRTYRIGQNKNVFIYNLIHLASIDIYINNIINQKINVTNSFLQDGISTNIDKVTLHLLFRKLLIKCSVLNNQQFINEFNQINNIINHIQLHSYLDNTNNTIHNTFSNHTCNICNQIIQNGENFIINHCGCIYHNTCADNNFIICNNNNHDHHNHIQNYINFDNHHLILQQQLLQQQLLQQIHSGQQQFGQQQQNNSIHKFFKCHLCRTNNLISDNQISNEINECDICLIEKNSFIKLKCKHQLCSECFEQCIIYN